MEEEVTQEVDCVADDDLLSGTRKRAEECQRTLARNRNFELWALQERNRLSITLDRCVDQRDKSLTHEIKQIIAACEGRVSEIVKRLKEIEAKLNQADQRETVIKQLLSTGFPVDDEFGNLIRSVVKLAFEAGQLRNVGTARNKLIANSDHQAERLAPLIAEIKEAGANTLQEIANALNDREIRTKNGHVWYPSTVNLLIRKIHQLEQNSVGYQK